MPEPTKPVRSRNTSILRERLSGQSLSQIGRRHDLTAEGVRLVVAREGRQQIDRIHLDLITSHGTGELPALAIPDHAGPDFELALDYLKWIVAELEERGMRVQVHYRPVHNGVVVALEDADPPINSKVSRSNA